MSNEFKYLVGRVATPPQPKVIASGKTLAEFRLAVDGPYDPATKTRTTQWFDATAWEPMDAVVVDNYNVGRRIWVAGETSVFHGTSGDKDKITIRDTGFAEKLVPSGGGVVVTIAPKAKAAPAGVELDEEGEW